MIKEEQSELYDAEMKALMMVFMQAHLHGKGDQLIEELRDAFDDSGFYEMFDLRLARCVRETGQDLRLSELAKMFLLLHCKIPGEVITVLIDCLDFQDTLVEEREITVEDVVTGMYMGRFYTNEGLRIHVETELQPKSKYGWLY